MQRGDGDAVRKIVSGVAPDLPKEVFPAAKTGPLSAYRRSSDATIGSHLQQGKDKS
jgi:hypothetical protein